MNRDRLLIVSILAATIVLTVQCGRASPTPTPSPGEGALGPPLAIGGSKETAIPSPGESPLSPLLVDVSPVNGPAIVLQGLPFSVDEPLREGDIIVSGTGPAQMGLLVVDVTMMGEVLGRGQVEEDGRFSIPVQTPLIVNHRIGLMLDDQSPGIVGSAQTQGVLDQLDQFSGESAITIPHVGKIYAAASVKP